MSSPNETLAHFKIPIQNILSATNNFAEENNISEDGFEKWYEGELLWLGELIDITALRFNNERDDEVEQMFWNEISMLSSLNHKNLVSFVGFCYENDEKIIIYKGGDRGSLSIYLSDPMRLKWVRRVEICVGVAHALSYIHYDESRDFSVIHRNINSYTVLLNDDWDPMLSNFQLSMKIKASQRHDSFYTDKVWDIEGYTDPIYLETETANHKSDMYSFGIILFELLCGRKAASEDQDNKYLARVAIFHYREKTLDDIIDPDLREQMDPQSFNVFTEIAYDCLNEERSKRPNIDEIVTRLEKALELQLARENAIMSSLKDNLAHFKIPFENVLSATNYFAYKNKNGENGFVKYYNGQLLWSGELIDITAVRFNNKRIDREQMFWNEISMVSSLNHKNIVSFVGFCDENDDKIIIYKGENQGSLSNHLSDSMLLTWVRRLEICVGVAHALSYIHFDDSRHFSLIHRFDCCVFCVRVPRKCLYEQ